MTNFLLRISDKITSRSLSNKLKELENFDRLDDVTKGNWIRNRLFKLCSEASDTIPFYIEHYKNLKFDKLSMQTPLDTFEDFGFSFNMDPPDRDISLYSTDLTSKIRRSNNIIRTTQSENLKELGGDFLTSSINDSYSPI